MADDDHRAFLSDLFEYYVRLRLPQVRYRFRRGMHDEWNYHLAQAESAAHVLRYIESHCGDDDDVYQTFTVKRLGRVVDDTRSSLQFSNRVTEEAGFLDAIDAHTERVFVGLRVEDLPEVDRDVLREMGSPHPAVDARVLVARAKDQKETMLRWQREVSVREQLREAERRLEQVAREFQEYNKSRELDKPTVSEERPKKSRRWFKGLGQIGQGAALSIANVALVIGVLHVPVSPETQTWGAIASVATGVGTILSGVGDLHNE